MNAPDYSNYSLKELYDVLNVVDSKAYPERVEEIQRQIKIKQEVDVQEAVEPKVWWLRFKAFCIDCILATFPIGLLDLFTTYPLPPFLFEVLYLAVFISYFWYFEVYKKTPTPGKARYELDVNSTSQNMLDTKNRIIRLSVFSIPFIINTFVELNIAVPFTLEVTLYGIVSATFFYNVLAAVYFPTNQTIHDSLSNSHICQNAELETQLSSLKPTYHWQMYIGLILFTSTSFHLLLDDSLIGDNSINQSIESTIASELGIRTEVSVTETKVWTLGKDNVTRQLTITIWVPIFNWNDATISKLVSSALEEFTVTPGYFNEGSITVTTGWLISFSETHELSLP